MSKERRKATINGNEDAFKEQGNRAMKMPTKSEWSTDFTDHSKYKLSESEMIQKKAACQSKHREEARNLVQERTKKLEMGIVDDDTRKVYETALAAKNIDMNQPVRKNLSQMIQYEKQIRQSQQREQDNVEQLQAESEEDLEEDDSSLYRNQPNEVDVYKKQLKEAQQFIKKFERAKKQDKIQRAVNILEGEQRDSSQDKKKKHSIGKPSKSSTPRPPKTVFENERLKETTKTLPMTQSNASNTYEQTLSNIEDTIRFMEDRLFSNNRPRGQASSSENTELTEASLVYRQEHPVSSHGQFTSILDESNLLLDNTQEKESSQCLDTIRRMQEMMASKEKAQKPLKQNNIRNLNEHSNYLKQSGCDEDAQIDFSLTNNSMSIRNAYCSLNFGATDPYDEEYEKVKKSLFDEVRKLQECSMSHNQEDKEDHFVEHSFKVNNDKYISPNILPVDESSISYIPKPSFKKTSNQLERIRSQISGLKQSVDGIKVSKLSLPCSSQTEVVGLDFRGSINIKKNVINEGGLGSKWG